MKPLLVIFSGLPGVGKSSIAQMLSARLGAVYLRADTIENAIVEGGITQPIEGAGYVVGYRVATENLLLGNTVVADSVNPWELTRQAWRDSAIGANAPFVDIEIICSDTVEHRRRVEDRGGNVTWDDVLRRDYHEHQSSGILRLDSAILSVEEAVNQIEQHVLGATAHNQT